MLFKLVLGIAGLLGLLLLLSASGLIRSITRTVKSSSHQLRVVKSSKVSEFTSSHNLYHGDVSDENLSFALADTGHRIDKNFAIPGVLRTSVSFWLKIYTRYSSLQAVLFDSNTMEIYEELDFRKIAKTARNQMVYEITVENLIKKKIDLYQKAFLNLKMHSKTASLSLSSKKLTHEAKNILNLKDKTQLSLNQLALSVRLMRGQRDNIIKGLSSVETFNPKMEAIFSFFKVPVELTRLSLVESSFNLNARSKVGAAGVWQFMESSGKSYLTIDPKLKMDERLSPLKATAAAAKMLYWNYKYLGSWPLAVISYNHGLRSLPRLKVGSNSFAQIEHLFENQKTNKKSHPKKALGWASRNYYSEFLAVLYAEKYRDLFYGEAPAAYIRPVSFTQLDQSQSAYSLAVEKGISIQDFRLFNADIEDIHQTLPKGYWVVAPSHGEDLKGLKEYTVRSLKRVHWAHVVHQKGPSPHASRAVKRSLAFEH